ncbi:transcription factor ETV6-like [Daphnia pulicaria]|uniref:transcription factor ETV6-like n=1 Tax=Daphnia pulicaria TaxID=35523 RepID=UPI001EE9FA63|nr:transcription factor ETV6-like [Daphnia pulicaria]
MYTPMFQMHTSVWPSEVKSNQEYLSKDSSHQFYALPEDPRSWSREEVFVWLLSMQNQHSLPPISSDRFHMNGKALCLMNVEMFVQRVPLGGKLLYKDFQMRLSSALYSSKNLLPHHTQ